MHTTICIRYWHKWFFSFTNDLANHLKEKFVTENINIVNEPVEVEKDDKKPFEVTVNGVLVYSTLTPIDGEKGPILFSSNKWWGEPEPKHIERIEKAIAGSSWQKENVWSA